MTKTPINEFDVVENNRYESNLAVTQIKEPVPRLIKDVLEEYNRGEINLQPEFQRQFVWSKSKQKELIKSLYAGFPLPMFYFAKSGDNHFEVVDGQQRLTTIIGFLKPEKIDKSIRSKMISKIQVKDNGGKIGLSALQHIIKNRNIYCVYLPETTVNLKYEIFQILNQGATMLKSQEIRNCLFASELPKFNKLLKTVANKLRKITGMTLDRMLGEELALRFFVINKYGYEQDISDRLNNFNMLKKDFSESEIKKMKKQSDLFFRFLKLIFEKDIIDCFQVFQRGIKLPKTNQWKLYTFSKKINQSLFHLLSYYLPKYSTHQINKKNLSKIKKGYLELLRNKNFVAVITGSGTNSTRNIKKSNLIFKKVFLDKYIGDWSIKSKRNISMQEKATIRKNVPYCYLCYGKLRDNLPISKIHADHIEAYSFGGVGKFSNILLAHQKCNSEKKNMTLDEYRATTKSINRRRRQKKNIPGFCQALKNWNKEYKLDIYSRLMKFAKIDLVL